MRLDIFFSRNDAKIVCELVIYKMLQICNFNFWNAEICSDALFTAKKLQQIRTEIC